MSRTLRKAVEVVKHRKDTELNLPDEGIANLEDVPELCELWYYHSYYWISYRLDWEEMPEHGGARSHSMGQHLWSLSPISGLDNTL